MEKKYRAMEKLEMNRAFWKNKDVLITGHTGFKGTWLSLMLNELGANISGISLKPEKNKIFFNSIKKKIKLKESIYGDIRQKKFLEKSIKKIRPKIIFHLAAQPLVLNSYKDPVGTYETNIIGMINLLETVRKLKSIKSLINVTSDKCYHNKNKKNKFRETDPLGGFDPYSSSKACSEIITTAYYNSFLKDRLGIATVRAGNIIGGGDWSDNRLIPDVIRSLKANRNITIRYPLAVRPWQHVIDPLIGYIKLMEKLYEFPNKYSSSWNFGPKSSSEVNVKKIVKDFLKLWNSNIKIKVEKNDKFYESSYLALNTSKVSESLKWKPEINYLESLKMTANWYEAWIDNVDLYEFSRKQINQLFKKKYVT